MTPKQSEALELQEQGLTYSQIADQLDISETAVNDRLARARRHLNGTKAPKRSQAGKKLFPREAELLDLKRQGLSHVQIAERMDISIRTVKNYMNNIRKKGVIIGRRINRRIQHEN
jgi:DNA-binding CsgD family transcriptional regulator